MAKKTSPKNIQETALATENIAGETAFENLDTRKFILVKGARANNLKGIDVAIPRGKLVVITGLSGSGKSSLAFDTIFAEGQRMYVESLSSYARQFLGRMEKPDVEWIKGVSPAIAIEQKVATKNPRSTVGTTTEIYDFLKLLFARIGRTFSPISGAQVHKNTVDEVVAWVHTHEENKKISILAPIKNQHFRTLEQELKIVLQKGFTRILRDDKVLFIEDFLAEIAANSTEKLEEKATEKTEKKPTKKPAKSSKTTKENVSNDVLTYIVIDRIVVKKDDEDNYFRVADSVQTAFFEGLGECVIDVAPPLNLPLLGRLEENAGIKVPFPAGERDLGIGVSQKHTFSDKFELDGITFEEPSVNFFTFNNPYGACRRCEGFGNVLGIDEDLVISDKTLSVYEGAVVPWRTDKMQEWQKAFIKKAIDYDFPVHRAYQDLNEKEKNLLWNGAKGLFGIDKFFEFVEKEIHKIQYRVMLSRYRGKTLCPDCKGTRLRKDAHYVKIDNKSIQDLVLMPIDKLVEFFKNFSISDYDREVAKRILTEIESRLGFIENVGLPYLTLNRTTSTLSGGEYQRIKLSTSLGSALVGSMYILDEPSIGLHPRDTQKLIEVLHQLRDLGNTVIVVEHEEEVMQAADEIIDIGKEAGAKGGYLVFQGSFEDAKTAEIEKSYTLQFLRGTDKIDIPKTRRKSANFIEIKGARENNLKNIDVKIPLGVLTVITGVSGSGKSTLVKKILYPALAKHYNDFNGEITGKFDSISGDLKLLHSIEFIDQNPIGKSSRSNPVTYLKAYDAIRDLYANQPLAKALGYKAGFFSFNVDGGRCDTCNGEGEVKIEMQFMADVYLKCESCNGTRFKKSTLDVKYQDKNIAQLLDLTLEESLVFFEKEKKILDKLRPLQDVGLGYVRLGQSSNTLSGGEAQRVKLGAFLSAGGKTSPKMFVFDEPTTGLHFHDIKKLLKAINALIEQGHTVVIIEHNLDVIKCADWVIDLGKEGGDKGGYICYEGTPEGLIKQKNSYTADFLKDKM